MITLDDDYRLEDFGFRAYLDHEHQATPDIIRKTLEIPGRAGAWNFGSEIGQRPFNIPLRVADHDQINLQQKQNKFVAFLFDAYGKPRPFKISFDYEPDKHYMVELSSYISPSNAIYHLKTFGLYLTASDPYKYSNVYADEVTWGSEIITFEYNYLLGHESTGGSVNITGPQTLNISVEGLAVQPIIEIDGTANSLTLSANGHSFSLPNFSNTKWTIDFEKYLVFRNGQETMIEIRDFYLIPGDNEISITGSSINIDLAVKFRDKFI